MFFQVLSMIFEMYLFWRGLSGEEFSDVRKLDIIFTLLYLLHSVVFLLVASFSAANVAEEVIPYKISSQLPSFLH